MKNIKNLAKLMGELEKLLSVCTRCGTCQSVCPLFAETGREADVARGKLALLDGLLQEMFKNPRDVSKRLNRCLLCGSCVVNCSSSVSVMEIFIKARAILAGFTGLSPAKKLILRGMLSRPELFDRLTEWGARFQKIFTRPVNDLIGTSCARFVSPLIGNRHFMPLAPVPFHRVISALNTDSGRAGIKVAFFVGCLMDKFFPEIPRDVIRVLNHHGVGIFMPLGQACCGIPAISSGDTMTFNSLVRHNLKIFSAAKFDYLITACATCTSTIKKIWPMMVDKSSGYARREVEKIADKTLDICRFLVSRVGLENIESGHAENPVDITYHDPCHLKKSLGISKEPRFLIEANPDYRLKEMPESDRCCGLGGSFNLQYYELSTNIGKIKRDHIVGTGSSVVATGCPACMLQISDMLSKSCDQITVTHPISIYAELLDATKSS